MAAVAAAPFAGPLATALGLGYRALFFHGMYDTATTFMSRTASRVDEFVDDTFDEVTEGMKLGRPCHHVRRRALLLLPLSSRIHRNQEVHVALA